MVDLNDIRDILIKYKTRYRWLDVFTVDVRELSNASFHDLFNTIGENRVRVAVGDEILEAQLFPVAKVARFELTRTPVTGALLGASAGAAIGASLSEGNEAPAGAIFGLLVGGLAGFLAEEAARPKKVLTLVYNSQVGDWSIYNGPYVSWAKEALQAS